MKNYVIAYILDGNAEPSLFFVSTEHLPEYLDNMIGNTIVLWEDFDANDPHDCANNEIPEDAMIFLRNAGLDDLSPNESITIREIPKMEDFKII